MLTAIQCSTGSKILARSVAKEDGPFQCPTCSNSVIVNKGNIRVHHFKHAVATSTCPRGAGESEAHFQCKTAIYNALSTSPDVSRLEMEADFGISIADVYAVIRGVPVAIEVQKSILTPTAISQRTQNYEKLGIYVLWIGVSGAPLPAVYRPKAWEKWCHAAYLGRVYYWLADAKLLPVHFDGHSTFREQKTIFKPGGIEQSVGGYDVWHKADKRPSYGPVADIANDFRAVQQAPYTSKSLNIPQRKIYIDRGNRWW